MTALIKAWANFTIAYRLPIIAGSIALLLVALLTGKNIPFDNSTERYFVAGDPALIEYDNLIELFGDNEYLIVGFESASSESDIFNADTLRDIAKVSDFLEYHEYVTQLRSITNFQFIHGDGDDLRTDYLIENVEDLIGNAGLDGVKAAHSTIINIWRPAFFTAITTAAGFFALSLTKILPIKEFALLGAIGSITLFLFSLTVLPAVLSYMKKIPATTNRVLDAGFISKLTQKIPDFTLRNRNRILFGGLVVLLFSIWNIPNIVIDSNYVTLFKESSQTRQDIEYFDDVYRGMMNLDIILDSGEEEGIKDPTFLVQLDEIQSWLQQRETLGPINSIADYLKEINQALNGDDSEFYRLPSSREMTAQLLLLYESSGANEDLSDIKDFENRRARLVVPVVNMEASVMQAELESIEAYLGENYPHLQAVVTGTMALYTVQDTYISEGMALSFLVALGVITLFFITLFKSIKYGLLSIIPSVLPIVLAGSFAGWLGISLDQSAVIVFAMTMGIAVDDAIHVMSRYLLAKSEGASTKQAIAKAMNESGRAVVFSSIVLVFGFSVLCFASFTTIIYIGLFGSIIMTLALVGDLVMLPAILYWVDGDDDEDVKLAPTS